MNNILTFVISNIDFSNLIIILLAILVGSFTNKTQQSISIVHDICGKLEDNTLDNNQKRKIALDIINQINIFKLVPNVFKEVFINYLLRSNNTIRNNILNLIKK